MVKSPAARIMVFVCVAVAITWASVSALGMERVVSDLPMPLNSPPGAQYKMPADLPGKSGGPFLNVAAVRQIAIDTGRGHGESSPEIKDVILTTHGALIEEGVFSASYSREDDREVYLITLAGNFVFLRVPPGCDPIKATHINIEVDATDGHVLSVGTCSVTQDPEVLRRLGATTVIACALVPYHPLPHPPRAHSLVGAIILTNRYDDAAIGLLECAE